MAELKPCPFCGGKAQIEKNEDFVDVSCKDMFCRGWTSCLEYKTKQQAIEAWNRRAEDGK